MLPRITAAVMLCTALGVGGARADVWDVATDSDNSYQTDNQLEHGAVQVHDLSTQPGPFADEDWFVGFQAPYSSYEYLVEGATGDLFTGIRLDRVDSAGGVIQQAQTAGFFALSLAFANGGANPVNFEWVRVGNTACDTTCTSLDQYTIRFYETNYSIPRFNNSGTQTTSVILQNTGDSIVTLSMHFWDAGGNLLTSFGFDLQSNQSRVVNTAAPFPIGPQLAGQSGNITISNNGRYGQLSGKAVALEPSTGFTFDTPMFAKPH